MAFPYFKITNVWFKKNHRNVKLQFTTLEL